MNAPAARVGSLIRLLSSPQEGEALAACRALGRALHAAGLDFHALANCAERHLGCAEFPHVDEDWQAVAESTLRAGWGRLSPKEEQFLKSMSAWRRPPSQHQREWLQRLADIWLRAAA